MSSVNGIIKRIILSSVFFAIFIVFANEKISYIRGLILGTILAIVLLKLIEIDVSKFVFNKVRKFPNLGYPFRLFLIIAFMSLSAYDSLEMLIGTTLGILSLKVAIYSGIFFKNILK